MKKSVGKRLKKICTAVAAVMFLSLAVLASAARADVLIENFWFTMYDVDYDAVVESPQGAESLRYGAGLEYPEANGKVANGEVIHVFGECRADDGTFWGRVKYNDRSGFLPLSSIKKTAPQSEETTAAETTAEETAAAETTAAETSAAAETTAAAEQTPGAWKSILSTLFSFIRSLF
ncbi:MAG: hypothetical protein IJT43_06345 [Stomatobaculum sp.]|nr:hypothetical protein [Stomatobaculum sp.]